jgi:hypothetical protein
VFRKLVLLQKRDLNFVLNIPYGHVCIYPRKGDDLAMYVRGKEITHRTSAFSLSHPV